MHVKNKDLIKSTNELFKNILLEIKIILNFEQNLDPVIQQKQQQIEKWLNILDKSNNLFKTAIYKKINVFLQQKDLHENFLITNNVNLFNYIKEANIKISTFKKVLIEHLSNYYRIDLKQNKKFFNKPNKTIIFSDKIKSDQSKSYKHKKLNFISILDNLIIILQEINHKLLINKQNSFPNEVKLSSSKKAPKI